MGFVSMTKGVGCLGLLAATALTPILSSGEDFPNKPIRMIVPLPPGTSSDFFARVVGQGLSDTYRQQVVVDNRPGAGGLIGSSLLVKAAPDGYTLAMIAPPHVAAALLQSKPPYHPLNDVAAVAEVCAISNALVIAPKVPAGGIREFIAYAKANPGKLNFASAGIGTSAHIAAEIFNQAAGIQGVHVPFKLMADVYTAMLADQVQYYVFVLPTALPMLRDGKLRALAVTSSKRNAALPDVPTVVEAGLPEAQSSAWFGVVAPTGTPRKIIVRLHTDIVRILRESETRKRFNVQGADASVDTTPDAFKSLIKSEYARYQKLIRDIDLKPQ